MTLDQLLSLSELQLPKYSAESGYMVLLASAIILVIIINTIIISISESSGLSIVSNQHTSDLLEGSSGRRDDTIHIWIVSMFNVEHILPL